MSDSLRPHESQHARPPCPSPTPRVYPNSWPLSRWYHPTISSPVIPFSSHLQSFPASESFQMNQLFVSKTRLLYSSLVLMFFSCHVNSALSSVVQSCPTLCDPIDCNMPGFPIHHQLPELAQTHVHHVGDAIQPSHPLVIIQQSKSFPCT